jgi:hypothetical protein
VRGLDEKSLKLLPEIPFGLLTLTLPSQDVVVMLAMPVARETG